MPVTAATRFAGGAAVSALLLALAACGSSSSSGGSGSGTPLTVTAADFRFSPTQLSAQPGETITVTLQNQGKTEHSFTLDSGNGSVDADPGESKTLTFTAPQSGTLSFHCKYHPTQMKGTITVGGSGAGGSSSSSSTSSSGY
jgi:plastocyanin